MGGGGDGGGRWIGDGHGRCGRMVCIVFEMDRVIAVRRFLALFKMRKMEDEHTKTVPADVK